MRLREMRPVKQRTPTIQDFVLLAARTEDMIKFHTGLIGHQVQLCTDDYHKPFS